MTVNKEWKRIDGEVIGDGGVGFLFSPYHQPFDSGGKRMKSLGKSILMILVIAMGAAFQTAITRLEIPILLSIVIVPGNV